eukprot:6429215-Ditylum_brightwellii.AAC.1
MSAKGSKLNATFPNGPNTSVLVAGDVMPSALVTAFATESILDQSLLTPNIPPSAASMPFDKSLMFCHSFFSVTYFHPCCKAKDYGMKGGAFKMEKQNVLELWPVSYTHLTLPTN